jgi:DNA-binding GntR family transcriptional regulator
LNVQELSERLQLGRSPVHYAVHRLQHDGLLEVIQRKGILVRSWSPQAINHVVEARIPLEMVMVRLAAERATEEQLRALKARLTEGKKLVTAKNRQGLMELDHDFHAGLAACAANPVIAELLQTLHQRSTPLWSTSIAGQRDYAQVQEQHEKVLARVAARDAEGAAEAVRQHLQALVRK